MKHYKCLRRCRNILSTFFIIIMLLLRGSHFYERRTATDKNVVKKLSQRVNDVQVGKFTVDKESVRYAELGNNKNPTLIFVHGSPGDLTARYSMIEKTNITKKYHIILVDRPGYGKSYHGSAVTSIEKQAKMLEHVLSLNKHKTKPLLIGHSFGAPIVAKMASEYPEKVGGLLIFAGAVDPEHEIIRKITYPMEWKVVRWMIPASLRVTNREKLTHIAELQKLKKKQKKITQPITVMHGKSDWIVPIENAYFIEKYAIHADLKMIIDEERSHIIPFTDPWILVNEIEKLYEKVKTTSSS